MQKFDTLFRKYKYQHIHNNHLINGDCLDVMSDIPDKSVNLILCDLPFGTTKNKWDIIIPFDKLWSQYERILSSKGNIILFGTGLFAYKLALSNEKLFRYDMIWKKSKCGSPLTAKYMPMKRHELILVFGKSASTYNPQMTEGTPYSRKWTPNKTNNMQYGIEGVVTNNIGTRHPITILDFPQKWRRQDQIHPTQKPMELMTFLVKSFSNDGDVVMDNCFGSNSVGKACVNENRLYIGIEKDVEYYNMAINNLNK
jgi:DNA modification methylase